MDGTACFLRSSTDVSMSNTAFQTMERVPATMNAAQHFVVVNAPVDRVYQQWSNLEDLPKFVPPLKDVCRIDDKHFSYRWANNSDQKGVFHIVLQIPGRRIAWRAMSHGFMSGVVSFEPRSQNETEVTLKIRSIADPPGLTERVEEYLCNFKRLVEKEVSAS
ncbi:MAG TPA: SRPBCC family protein [Candidatus Udaeobacter sp.]|nr:SRPBCC family protein [Candidatus Udaeobacter sp.]